jgi:hypothetical protein
VTLGRNSSIFKVDALEENSDPESIPELRELQTINSSKSLRRDPPTPHY